MDEILIGEKKYISSKKAAKITGYAKDYIGQLCREGRVSARLVGRSWYVLESALHDHRFGESKKGASETLATKHATWQSPRYEASEVELLPSVTHRSADREVENDSEVEKQIDTGDKIETAEHLKSAWQEWFDHVGAIANTTISIKEDEGSEPVLLEKVVEDVVEEAPLVTEEAVEVPIHAIYQSQYQTPVEERSPQRPESPSQIEMSKRSPLQWIRAFQLTGALFALFMATAAVLGSGYFDKYIISNSQVGIIAGVALYNR